MDEPESHDPIVTIEGVDHRIGDEHCAAGKPVLMEDGIHISYVGCHGGLMFPGVQDPDVARPRPHGCTAQGCLLHATEDVEQGDVCGEP